MTIMPSSSRIFSQYYMAPEPPMPPNPYAQPIHLHHQDHQQHQQHQHQHMSHSMQPPPSPSIPIDPALALYPPSFYPQYHTQHQMPQQLSLAASLSSPSSQASDAISTPPTEQMSYPGPSKRPSSSNTNDADSRKRPRKDEDNEPGPSTDRGEPKAKPTRGARYDFSFGGLFCGQALTLAQSMHRLPPSQDEVRRRRARPPLQALSLGQPRVHIRRV